MNGVENVLVKSTGLDGCVPAPAVTMTVPLLSVLPGARTAVPPQLMPVAALVLTVTIGVVLRTAGIAWLFKPLAVRGLTGVTVILPRENWQVPFGTT